MPEDEVQAGKEKLDALIAEGNTSFNEGRTDEAFAIAETAIASNPSSTSALSLKALCHERRGELAEALECADLIVDLNPDSELDKIKRNQLRSKLAMTVQLATQEPDRRMAVVSAVAAMVLMICIGIAAAKLMNRNEQAKQSPTASRPETPAQQQTGPGTVQNSVNNGQNNNVQPRNPIVRQPAQSDRVAEADSMGSILDPGSVLPQTGRGPGADVLIAPDPNSLPTNPNGPIGSRSDLGSKVVVPTPSGAGVAKSGAPSLDPNPTTVDPKDSPQNDNPGQIEIKISDGSRRTNSGGGENLTTMGASALVHVGMQRFQLGQFNSAARSFEDAIRAGGDQMSLNQRLGQCYDNMGRKSEAIEAYKRGIAACQAALSGGGGNKDSVQRRLESCQQALKVLQGN